MPYITSTQEVSDELAFYIQNEALSLAQRDTFSIENFIDREAFNPDVQAYLNSPEAAQLFGDGMDNSPLSLTFAQEKAFLAPNWPNWLRFRFKKFKKLIKRVFCEVVTSIEDAEIKDVIKAVLVGLIPAFGAGGLPGIAIGILIGFVALLIKAGIQAACPA
ncbi:hypothetical protein HER32_10850 [Hymenobacter sp. BT18]|uniref:hypothetical protein n=1 Tax=Hymenobacter sp. BT18 TaxID=2835648 RepID=UPI00143E8ED9|nr:hypothetical protein [Hymenobacter sp. BT18]QIX61649.1 hypothetical protein HER32_10850 [Hymenobacter sp. BT18]